MTVYDDDEETYRIWRSKIGISDSRILKIGDNKGGRYSSDNFWQMADTGPCGPCTEIFLIMVRPLRDLPGTTNEGDRFIEIWNLVFMQFYKDKKGRISKLPNQCVDTGWDWREFLQYFRELRITIKPIPFSFDVWRGKIIESGGTGYHLIKSNIRPHKIDFHLLREGVNPGNEGRVMCLGESFEGQSDMHISVS